MPTITIELPDAELERIADLIAAKIEAKLGQRNERAPKAVPAPTIVDDRLQLDRERAAKRLGCSVATLDRLVKRGLLHPNRATSRPMFPITELDRFIRECSQVT